MQLLKWLTVPLSLVLYAVGLYGFWRILSDHAFHWAVVMFPCGLLLMAVAPFLTTTHQRVSVATDLEEDRTE
jgi:hypothetical protein